MQIKVANDNLGEIDIQNEKNLDNSYSLLYRGKEELTFAVQACRIIYDKDSGIISLIDPKRDVVLGEEDEAVYYLKTDEDFIEI